jgi:hypothetical protein
VGSTFKGKELQVFLFEQNIIFSEAVGKKTQFTNPVYIHKAHIQVGPRDYLCRHNLEVSCEKFIEKRSRV